MIDGRLQLSHEDTRIVSLTVTEKGYCQDVNGDLDRVSEWDWNRCARPEQTLRLAGRSHTPYSSSSSSGCALCSSRAAFSFFSYIWLAPSFRFSVKFLPLPGVAREGFDAGGVMLCLRYRCLVVACNRSARVELR